MLKNKTVNLFIVFSIILSTFFISNCYAKKSTDNLNARQKKVILSLDHYYKLKISKLLKSGNIIGLETFIKSQKKPDQARTAALILSSYYGNKKMVMYLIDHGAYTSKVLKFSPLVAAVAGMKYSIIEYLLSNGVDINAMGSIELPFHQKGAIIVAGSGGFALRTAVLMNEAKMIKFLLQKGAKVDPNRHSNMFLFAAQIGSVKAMRQFLNHGIDVNILDDEGQTALIRASVYGAVDSVDFLLSKKADTNILTKGRHSRTALMFAAWNGHADVITRLTSHGVGVYDSNESLMIAAQFGHYLAVKALVDGVNIPKETSVLALIRAEGTLIGRVRMARNKAVANVNKLNDTKKIIKLLSTQTSLIKTRKSSLPQEKKSVTTNVPKKKQARSIQEPPKILHVKKKKKSKVVGCWKWSNGAYIIVNKNGLVKNGDILASWKIKGKTDNSYIITWPPILDKITMSKDGRSLSGKNSFGFPVNAKRVSGNIKNIVGQWKWANGINVVIASDKSVIGGPFKGVWSKKEATYVITWPITDSIEFGSNKNKLKGANQFGKFTAKRDRICTRK